MAPKAPSLSQLFHPKKKAQQKQYSGVNGQPKNFSKQGSPRKTQSPAASASTSQTAIQVDDDDDTFTLPNTSYSEFRILSSAMQGWKYDVMKFDSRKLVDLNQWQRPIKLNRKDLRRDDPANVVETQPQAVGPMLGPDGKPVIGVDGRVVMVDAEGKPIHSGETGYGGGASGSASSSKDKGKGNAAGGRKRFQKKTRQVYLVPEEVRQLRKEERYPWVMEDSSPGKGELWIGHLEEVSKAETHGLFMPAQNDSFKFIPPHRWYKFQKKVKHELPTDTANVESMVSLITRAPFIYTMTDCGSYDSKVYPKSEERCTGLARFAPRWKGCICRNRCIVQAGSRRKTSASGGAEPWTWWSKAQNGRQWF